MDQAVSMGGGESAGQRANDPPRFRFPDRHRRVDHITQRLSLDVLHHDVGEPELAGDSDPVYLSHIRVRDQRRRPGLPFEAEAELRHCREVRGNDLDRDEAPKTGLRGEVHRAHTPGAKDALKPVIGEE